MLVRQCMTESFASLDPSSTFRQVIETFERDKTDIAPVIEQGRLAGVITKYILFRCLLKGVDIGEPIEPYFIRDVITVNAEDDLYAARETLLRAGVAHAVVVDAAGRVAGILGKSDIIRGFHVNAAKLASQMSSLVNHMHNGLIAVNREGEITVCNPAAARMIGRDRNQLIGHKVQKVIPGLEPALRMATELAHPYPVERLSVGRSIAFVTCTPILENDPPGGAMAILQDMTEYERIAKELETTKKLEETLQTVINLAFDGLAVFDKQGRIVMANDSLADLLNTSKEALIGQPARRITGEPLPEAKLRPGQECLEPRLINGRQCVLTITPIVRSSQTVGTIVKVMYRSLAKWKQVLQQVETLQKELSLVRGKLSILSDNSFDLDDIVTADPQMALLKEQARQIAAGPSHVLLLGESGTGKELFARGIHAASGRTGRFIKVNCAAIPHDLLESELFGYADGAFTGAKRGGKPGKFELADEGTFFLDEIGDLPLPLQAKLLRVIQEKEFERLGSTETIRVNARMIAATNRNLEEMVQKGLFREDLYYRLNVITLHVPPLRERKSDIPLLANALLQKYNHIMGLHVEGFSPESMMLLQRYDWPGNVRELENAIERALNYCKSAVIEKEHLPAHIREGFSRQTILPFDDRAPRHPEPRSSYRRAIGDAERGVLLSALQATNGNRAAAARLLGISRSQFYKKLAAYGILGGTP
jgi:PAS domain S-box-containing protein